MFRGRDLRSRDEVARYQLSFRGPLGNFLACLSLDVIALRLRGGFYDIQPSSAAVLATQLAGRASSGHGRN
jgi:hypothetical protein